MEYPLRVTALATPPQGSPFINVQISIFFSNKQVSFTVINSKCTLFYYNQVQNLLNINSR